MLLYTHSVDNKTCTLMFIHTVTYIMLIMITHPEKCEIVVLELEVVSSVSSWKQGITLPITITESHLICRLIEKCDHARDNEPMLTE